MKKKKVILGCLGVFVVVVVVLAIWIGPVIRDFAQSGILGNQLSAQKMREYQGNSEENLKALYTAFKLYHDSEGAYPDSAKWMDAVTNRIKAGDMTQEEANKKFVDPRNSSKSGEYGYAMNDACSKMYIDDIKDKENTPLIFESTDRSWNAHGKPEKLLPKPPLGGANLAISCTGKILHLK